MKNGIRTLLHAFSTCLLEVGDILAKSFEFTMPCVGGHHNAHCCHVGVPWVIVFHSVCTQKDDWTF